MATQQKKVAPNSKFSKNFVNNMQNLSDKAQKTKPKGTATKVSGVNRLKGMY